MSLSFLGYLNATVSHMRGIRIHDVTMHTLCTARLHATINRIMSFATDDMQLYLLCIVLSLLLKL